MKFSFLMLCFIAALITAPLWAAEQSEEELAKAAQNPIANMISLPFQNNTNFNVGPDNKTQNVLNIQPVISQPAFGPGQDTQFGLGDTAFSAFLAPAKPGEFIWGVGPIVQLPTHTDDRLGSTEWGLGPTVVALRMDGPWVYGALVNNVFIFLRSFYQDPKNLTPAVALVEQSKIYPLNGNADAKPMKFPNASGVLANMLPISDGSSFDQLKQPVDSESATLACLIYEFYETTAEDGLKQLCASFFQKRVHS